MLNYHLDSKIQFFVTIPNTSLNVQFMHYAPRKEIIMKYSKILLLWNFANFQILAWNNQISLLIYRNISNVQ